MTSGNNSSCEDYEFDDSQTRYYMMAVVCPVISVLGLLGNTASIVVFSRRQRQQATANAQAVFFIALAAYDNGVLITAFAIYTIEMIYDSNRILSLYMIWLDYLPTLFFLSNMFQCGAIYVTIIATCERWLSMSYRNAHSRICSVRGASLIAIGVAIAAISFCISRYWELETIHMYNCTGFAAWHIIQTDFAVSEPYKTFYGVYLQNAFLIFIPFICMLAFNTLISVNIKDEERRREANVTMLVVALTFLICSLPGFLLTIMEHVPSMVDFLWAHPYVYSRFRDVVNMLTVVNSSVNFFIYLIFGGGFRKDFRSVVTGEDVLWNRNVLLTANIPLLLCSGPVTSQNSQSKHHSGQGAKRCRIEKTQSCITAPNEAGQPKYQSIGKVRRAQSEQTAEDRSGSTSKAEIPSVSNGELINARSESERLCATTHAGRRTICKPLLKGTSFMGVLQHRLYGRRIATFRRVDAIDESDPTEQTELTTARGNSERLM